MITLDPDKAPPQAKAPNLRTILLSVFKEAAHNGLTDEQAAVAANVEGTCYWKRCNELRSLGLISFTGATRKGSKDVSRKVSRITEAGRNAVVA